MVTKITLLVIYFHLSLFCLSKVVLSINDMRDYSHLYFKDTKKEIINESNIIQLDKDDLFYNILESFEIAHIFNEYSHNSVALNLLYKKFNDDEISYVLKNINIDNSLYFLRLGYFCLSDEKDKQILEFLKYIDNASIIERSTLIKFLQIYYLDTQLDTTKNKIENYLVDKWQNCDNSTDGYFIKMSYLVFRNKVNGVYDTLLDKNKNILWGGDRQPVPYYFSFVETCASIGNVPIKFDYITYSRKLDKYNVATNRDKESGEIINPWYKKAYFDLVNEKYILDADFIFYAFKNTKNEIMIDLAHDHIKNPEFKDARYKTVYYLVNHDFDTSFPVLTNMVQNGELCHNEIKNFYRGLARLNKLSYSVLTPEQQQKANDYLKQQMLIEKDPSMKLYIDFLLSICIDDYSLSSERISLLNKFKDIAEISEQDKKQIDRRLNIIKWTKLQHYPSVFYSYVNGLDDKKPFIDVSKVDVQTLPIYYVEYGDNLLAYHDVNSEAYLAYNTNKISSQNIIIPSELDGYPVTAIAPYAFAGFRHSSTNVLIPSSVNNLFMYSFAYNTNLLSVAIPNSVTNIGVGVFSRSLNMETVFLDIQSELSDDDFYVKAKLNQNCKIIRTKFENGLPVIEK